ncbi:MAG: DEAD/DEAH box helicase, partial [Dehalococcoidia bacterium]
MTPLGGFFKKILGAASTPSPAPTDTRAEGARASRTTRTEAAAPDSRGAPTAGEGDQDGARRRGSRGGRGRGGAGQPAAEAAPTRQPEPPPARAGRGRGRGTPPAASTEPRSYSWSARSGGGDETEEQARQRRELASRQRRGRSSFRPYRENLDAPLPEDIAFRSGQEGGDRSILPARRRRGTGLRDTERVIVGGARTLSGWSRPVVGSEPAGLLPALAPGEDGAEDGTEPRLLTAPIIEPITEPFAEPFSAVSEQDEGDLEGPETDEDGAPRRRRRGRRGGRGRRRPGTPEGGADETDTAIAELRDEPAPAPRAADVPYDLDAPVGATETHPAIDDKDEDDDERAAERAAVEAATERPTRRPAARAPRALVTVDPATLPQAFAELGVGERTLQALARYGFTTPTPIQVRAIPALIKGRDVVGVAQTGSGKTIAFGVPMVEQLDPELAEVQGLVLVPTRELASQVLEVLKDLAAGFGLEAVGILGGHSLAGDFRALERRPAIVVGTPGRVIDHLQRGTLSLRYVSYAVLDEADQMLDIGFLPDIRRILSRTPKRRQTALFSATMPSTIRRLVWQFMDDPETVTVDPELST